MSSKSVALCLIPAAFWLWYLAGLGRQRWSKSDLALALFAGLLSPWPVLGLEGFLDFLSPQRVGLLGFFVFRVGLVEEFFKLLLAVLLLRLTGRIKEPLDGLVLGGCVALGFATAENVLYVERHGQQVLLGRALLATFGHVLMSSFWGYALGSGRWRSLFGGLIWATLVHGFYDWLLMVGWPSLAVLLLLGAWSVFRVRAVEELLRSSGRMRRTRVRRECSNCQTLVRAEARFCTNCQTEGPFGEAVCGSCLTAVPEGRPESCQGCGLAFSPWEELPERSD